MLCYVWWFFYKYMSYAFSFMNIFYCILCQELQILAFYGSANKNFQESRGKYVCCLLNLLKY